MHDLHLTGSTCLVFGHPAKIADSSVHSRVELCEFPLIYPDITAKVLYCTTGPFILTGAFRAYLFKKDTLIPCHP